ncbi:MAG: uracil-DNA glycosylase family protein [Acetobacter persici]|uniref:uracil-DNA glycosylase family protein n=1 Tax=Acetobacter persici TaxID=1076596 RepID=UPI0039EC2A99
MASLFSRHTSGFPADSTAEQQDDILAQFLKELRGCQACAHKLPLGPRPVIRISPRARLLIAGQAPGTHVHNTGIPFNDASGERLRSWLDMRPDVFYDPEQIAIVPMALCYPGVLPKGGDKPPPPECASLWRERILSYLPNLRLTLLVGSYAQNYVLGKGKVFERVLDFRSYLPDYFPLPHPSWRTGAWERKTPEFQNDVIPALREAVRHALDV